MFHAGISRESGMPACMQKIPKCSFFIVIMIHAGKACRLKVTTILAKRFTSPVAAEAYYHGLESPSTHISESNCSEKWQSSCSVQYPSIPPLLAAEQQHSIANCQLVFQSLESSQQLEFLSKAFTTFLEQNSSINTIPPTDFLQLVVQGMEQLCIAGRTNVIYSLAKGLGTIREGSTESLLPTGRMPMGMIEDIINFLLHHLCKRLLIHAVIMS